MNIQGEGLTESQNNQAAGSRQQQPMWITWLFKTQYLRKLQKHKENYCITSRRYFADRNSGSASGSGIGIGS